MEQGTVHGAVAEAGQGGVDGWGGAVGAVSGCDGESNVLFLPFFPFLFLAFSFPFSPLFQSWVDPELVVFEH